jgi:hypothetical protein
LSGNFDKIPHDAPVTFNCILSWDVPGTAPDPQPGWFWCQKCWSLFHGGSSRTAGICPLDYKTHDGSRSWAYSLYYDSPNNGQPGWYWCNNCFALFFGGGSKQAGNCPATNPDLGPHKAPVTYNYNIAH